LAGLLRVPIFLILDTSSEINSSQFELVSALYPELGEQWHEFATRSARALFEHWQYLVRRDIASWEEWHTFPRWINYPDAFRAIDFSNRKVLPEKLDFSAGFVFEQMGLSIFVDRKQLRMFRLEGDLLVAEL